MSNFNYNKNPAPFYNKNYGSNYAQNYSTFSSFFNNMNTHITLPKGEERMPTKFYRAEEDSIKDLIQNQGWSYTNSECNENQSKQVYTAPGVILYRCVLSNKQ